MSLPCQDVLVPCPVCSCDDLTPILRRERLPVMQNVTYATRELGRAAPTGILELSACLRCGFVFNSQFDASLMAYDTNYDNHVESAAFRNYYVRLATMLIERFGLDRGGLVYDVGCGQGTFLKVLCSLSPGLRGVGIDPSCEPVEEGNLKLIRGVFSAENLRPDADLILLRHVLEHIDEPTAFLRELRAAHHNVPLYVEVPDAGWIARNGAFWDLCYEHCNYFVPETLQHTLSLAGFSVIDQAPSFGGQYQWAICGPGAAEPRAAHRVSIDLWRDYARRESAQLAAVLTAVEDANLDGRSLIWGMATKGVVLSNLLPDGVISAGIDANPRKQGRYAAGSGLAIEAPSWLTRERGKATIFVMNPNYLDEIRESTRQLGVEADFRSL